ncbi:MAG: glucokinase, partial [Pseudomonadota bacterium]
MVDGALLVGDIGGTHARFAVAEADGRLRDIMVLRVADYRTFADALAAYVQTQSSAPQAACLALAGVVENGQVTVTNSGWVVHAEAIEKQHGFTKVHLINDFEAQAYFAGAMTAHSYLTLKDGKPVATAPLLVMGPGTGFG